MFSLRKPGSILAMLLVVACATSGAVVAQAQDGQVSSTLQAFRVVPGKDGTETFADATKAKSGEILEYRLVYENGTAGKIGNLQATLPIPTGTVLVPASARPAGAVASLDGKVFAAMPLMQDQKQPDGSVKKVPVPLEKYRSLRWTVPSLEAGAKATMAARVRILGPVAP